MILAGGDVGQYEMIKRGSVGEYLIKLNHWVDGIEIQTEQSKAHGRANRTK